MCRWMVPHFLDWIDYHGVTVSIELLEWGRTFSNFLGKTVVHIYGLAKVPECLYCSVKSKVFVIQYRCIDN